MYSPKIKAAVGTLHTNKVSKWCPQMNGLCFLCAKTNRQLSLPVCFDINVQTRLPAS